MNAKYILKITCPDQKGIIATITTALSDASCNLVELEQFTDHSTAQFFMRVVAEGDITKENLGHILAPSFKRFSISGEIHNATDKPKVLIMCSKEEHCLSHLLSKYRDGSLPIEIPLIISNHQQLEEMASWHKIPFGHHPVTPESKQFQEAEIERLARFHAIHYIVLARYMQVLSPSLCKAFAGKIINIHHSFLPAFKGANPYQQAHNRGVKVIGATAHFVTSELDEGPIIFQETIPVNHTHTVNDLRRLGSDVESLVLTTALKYAIEHRVFIDGIKTVVLKS